MNNELDAEVLGNVIGYSDARVFHSFSMVLYSTDNSFGLPISILSRDFISDNKCLRLTPKQVEAAMYRLFIGDSLVEYVAEKRAGEKTKQICSFIGNLILAISYGDQGSNWNRNLSP